MFTSKFFYIIEQQILLYQWQNYNVCNRNTNLAEESAQQQSVEQSVMIQMETEEIEIQSVKESSSEQEVILSSQEPSETRGSSEQEIVEEPAAASAEEIKQLEECIGIIIFRSGDSDIYYFPNDETISLYIHLYIFRILRIWNK